MPRLSSLVLKTLAGLGITLPAGGGIDWGSTLNVTPINSFQPIDLPDYAMLGISIGTTDAYTVIGRANYSGSNNDAKFGKIYLIDNATGDVVREHLGTSGSDDRAFGSRIAISDNYYAAVLAGGNTSATKLFVYDIATGSLQYTKTIQASSENINRLFVEMNDTYIMTSGPNTGVLIYDTASGAQITAPTVPSGYNRWAWQVSFDESRMAVSSTNGSNTGVVHVYSMAGGFPLLYSITSPVAGTVHFGSGQDGHAIAVSANRIAISNRTADSNKGKVYIYDATNGSLLYTLSPPAGVSYSNAFGENLASNDSYLAVGTPDHDAFESGGAVHLYDVMTGTLVHSFSNPGTFQSYRAYGAYGGAVGISEHRIAVGAMEVRIPTDANMSRGAGFVYNLYDIL